MGENNGSSALISYLENDIQNRAHALLHCKFHSFTKASAANFVASAREKKSLLIIKH